MIAKLSTLLVVCLIVGDSVVKAQDGRLKLCGREFIRMVISSCGSSSPSRHVREVDQAHRGLYSGLLGHVSSEQFLITGSGEVQQQQVPEWTSEHRPSAAASSEPEAASGEPQGSWAQPEDAREAEAEAEAEESRAFHRVRREGPAGLCCRSGCTMSELVQFC
ncbi:insulin-like 3 (Leydig cell) [Engraulis encrasicolus]|uniref:insulin-like 3 (Leydig cell) n=1 Tax=Engraulis encrasicolus TaxID=184585 RepID=UPI002FD799FC